MTKPGLPAIRESEPIQKINSFIYSPWCIAVLGLLTVLGFTFSLELVFYSIVAVYTIYVALFARDLMPIMPLFVFCYITPSVANNPGSNKSSFFHGTGGIVLIGLLVLALAFIIVRLIIDDEIGFAKMFKTKRRLLISMLVLSASYFLSGIGHPKYPEYVKSNLLFAFMQFGSLFLLYFILSSSVKWDKANLDYFAWFGLIMGLAVTAELFILYIRLDGFSAIIKEGFDGARGLNLSTGWGCRNNVGALISMSIPFAFYFASKKMRSSLFLLLACFLMVAVVLSASRASILGAAFAFAVCLVYTFFKCNNKKEYRITTLVIVCIGILGAIILHKQIIGVFAELYDKVFGAASDRSESFDSVDKLSSGRLDIYITGIKDVYLKYPIFGQSFFPLEEFKGIYTNGHIKEIVSIIPPRWHNTVVQMLASCGTVGMLAYSYHRIDTIILYFKKRTVTNAFIGLSVLTMLLMSLLDCHFFNIGPVFFYSTALAVMEFGIEREEKKDEPLVIEEKTEITN